MTLVAMDPEELGRCYRALVDWGPVGGPLVAGFLSKQKAAPKNTESTNKAATPLVVTVDVESWTPERLQRARSHLVDIQRVAADLLLRERRVRGLRPHLFDPSLQDQNSEQDRHAVKVLGRGLEDRQRLMASHSDRLAALVKKRQELKGWIAELSLRSGTAPQDLSRAREQLSLIREAIKAQKEQLLEHQQQMHRSRLRLSWWATQRTPMTSTSASTTAPSEDFERLREQLSLDLRRVNRAALQEIHWLNHVIQMGAARREEFVVMLCRLKDGLAPVETTSDAVSGSFRAMTDGRRNVAPRPLTFLLTALQQAKQGGAVKSSGWASSIPADQVAGWCSMLGVADATLAKNGFPGGDVWLGHLWQIMQRHADTLTATPLQTAGMHEDKGGATLAQRLLVLTGAAAGTLRSIQNGSAASRLATRCVVEVDILMTWLGEVLVALQTLYAQTQALQGWSIPLIEHPRDHADLAATYGGLFLSSDADAKTAPAS